MKSHFHSKRPCTANLLELIYLFCLNVLISNASAKCPWIFLKAGGQDGFGGETISRIGLMATALDKGLGYCHFPFHHLHHVGGSEDKLEEFMNLSGAAKRLFGEGYSCPKAHSLVLLGEGLVPRRKIICRKNKHVIGYCAKTHICASIFSKKPSKVLKLLPILRAAYGKLPQDPSSQNSKLSVKKVAVHIRRGDVPKERTLSNKQILQILTILRGKHEHDPSGYQIHIYSQGIKEDFELSTKEGDVMLHLSAATIPCRYGTRGMAKYEKCTKHNVSNDIVDELRYTFQSLASSDVLLVADSALSYAAGIYCEGAVYYLHKKGGSFVGGRKPMPSWIPLKIE